MFQWKQRGDTMLFTGSEAISGLFRYGARRTGRIKEDGSWRGWSVNGTGLLFGIEYE